MSRADIVSWPAGQHLALTYEIPDNFGGLTTAMLRRSKSITELTGSDVQILTLGLQPGLDDVRHDLVNRALLHDGRLLRNLWEELLLWDDSALAASGPDPRLPEPTTLATSPTVHPQAVTRRDGNIADVDILRDDGSVLARQRWIAAGERAAVTPYGDAVTHTWLWARDGRYLGGWHGTWDLWRHWVSVVAGTEPTHLLIDSATVADAFSHVHIDHTSISVVVHNNHLDGGLEPPYGALGRWRRFLFEHRDGFDALVFLTERQRADVELLLGPIPHAHVVPNLFEPTETSHRLRRDERRGVALASLDPRKRLDHAVKALRTAGVTSLHIYGTGPREDDLRALIKATGAPAYLEGQTSDPGSAFAQASYSVLTSTKEGLPLVLAESMMAGCIPIAYDVPYGPSDVITHGVDGYLVPMGDHAALGQQIATFLDLSRWRRRSMRQAAKRRAGDFAPRPVLTRWAHVLDDAARRRGQRPNRGSSTDEGVAFVHRFGEPRLDVRIIGCTWHSDTSVRINLDLAASVAESNGRVEVGLESVAVDAVHLPTGTRDQLTVQQLSGSVCDVELDLEALSHSPDHVFLVTATTRQFDLTATVRDFVVWKPWSSSPPVTRSGSRPALTLTSARGLTIATAKPQVVGHVTIGSSITVESTGAAGQPATRHELSAPGCDPILIPADGSGLGTATIPSSGRWRVRSEVGGRLHDLAWAADPADVPGGSTDAVRVRLTPRGYVRLEVTERSSVISGLEPTPSGCRITGSLQGPAKPHVGEVAADVEATSWQLDLSGLEPGVHRIRTSADGPDAGATDALQASLPLTWKAGKKTIELRRRGRSDSYEVAVER